MNPSTITNPAPGVIIWFKIYAALLCFLYLLTGAFSFVFLFGDPSELDMPENMARIVGVMMLVISAGLFVICLLPLILKPKPWLWVYNLVVICLGMTSACFLLICVPMLIFWLKPETRRYYGKDVI